ncbi:MAG: C40 family peptidase [Candidatus Sumerlaeaceae bacterium]
MRRLYQILLMISVLFGGVASAQDPASTTATATSDVIDTSTDYLSDEGWRRLPREARRARSRAQMLARFEPSGIPSAEKLDTYIERFRQINIYDPRLATFKVRADRVPGTTGTVKLEGEVSVGRYKSGIESALQNLNFTVAENRIAVLPAEELGADIYGLSTTAAATMRKEPRDRSEQVNSVPLGGMVRLLRVGRQDDLTTANAGWRGGGTRSRHGEAGQGENSAPTALEAGDWYLAQTSEGYLGFMRSDEIWRTNQYRLADGVLTRPTTVTVEDETMVLPVGTLLCSTSTGYALGPRGKRIMVEHSMAGFGRPVFTSQQVLDLMKPLMGVRYVWGGVTDRGIDCSGFTQFLWKTKGINLPRDAEEQATVGQIVAWGKDVEKAAQPGDLIFFMNESGRVNHVAVSLSGKSIIHSSGQDVHLSDLDEKKEDMDASMLDRILYARRVQGR